MRISEFYSCGDFLAGARMAKQEVVFACAAGKPEKRVIEANFPLQARLTIDGMPTGNMPRLDVACVRPPEDCRALLRILREILPRAIIMDGAGASSRFWLTMCSECGYESCVGNYQGRHFGLPRLDRKDFVVMTRPNARPDSYFHWPDPPAGTKQDAVFADVMEQDVSDARVPDKFRTDFVRPEDAILRFPKNYHKRYGTLVQQGEKLRRITPLEAKRLSGFPDDFEMPLSDTQKYRILGNCTWPPVVAAIIEELEEWLP